MFRPNRIGTPHFYYSGRTDSAVDWTPNSNDVRLGAVTGNVINAAPVADFGSTPLTWNGSAETLTLSHKIALLQQFTISEPLAGDAVGVEVVGAIDILTASNINIVPVFCQLQAAGGALLAAVTTGDLAALRLPVATQQANIANQKWRHCTYRASVVPSNSLAVAGVYGHGFLIYTPDTANTTLEAFHILASVRQLNDQQNVGYRDTLR